MAMPEPGQVDDAARRRVEREVLVPTAEDLRRSIALVIADGGQRIFTGCFVRAHGRPFLVTAKHCVEDIEDWTDVRIHSEHASADPPRARMLGRTWATSPDDFAAPEKLTRYDLAVLPLHPDYARVLRPTWFELEQLSSQRVQPGTRIMLIGFPTQLAQVERVGDRVTSIGLEPIFFLGLATSPPTRALDMAPKENVEFFVEYDPDDLLRLANDEQVASLHPRGMSGCGAFVVAHVEHGKLWRPEARHLAGIQSSFLRDSRLLRVKRAEHVARLLENTCVELDRRMPLEPRGSSGPPEASSR